MNKNPTMNSVSTTKGKDECNLCPTILQQAPYGILVCDKQGEITFANQLAAFLLQQDNLTEHNLISILELDTFNKAWERLLSGEQKNATLRTTPLSSDDNSPHLSLQASLLKETPDQKNRILIFIEDLSVSETLDAADQHYMDSLENLVDEKSKELEFVQEQLILSEKKTAMIETAGAVAHELRQPMTAIIATIELLDLDDNVENNPHLSKRFKNIQKQCLRMAETIKQMEQLVEYKTRPYVNGSLIIDLEESSQNK
ncbi:MAG: histidine kinase dimerization/phospho-acceptor domain-containing protein [Pseudomonadota bacterium]|nr:histidine kinase dimerization/phospho-acceptor domain-containing protein [Pseudomonadota bacterium]